MVVANEVVNKDDPVMRIVDRAMEAQTRLMMTYMESMRAQIRREVEREVRAEFGGDRTYFGKGVSGRNRERDEAIRRDARPVSEGGLGLSLRALGKKYHMGKTRVAEVLEEGRNNDVTDNR